MDPLTHTLFGAALADCLSAKRRLADRSLDDNGFLQASQPRRQGLAAAALIVGANLPDVDVLAYVRGADFALGFRRGWTHGAPALVLWPFVLAGVLLLVDRLWSASKSQQPAVRFGPLLGLSAIGVVSHPLLDWLNTYGVRLLMPLDGRWFYGDTLFIIDPWLWLILGGSLFLDHSQSRRALSRWLGLGVVTSLLILLGPGAGATTRWVWLASLAILIVLRWRYGSTKPNRWARPALAVAAVYVFAMWGAMLWAKSEVRDQLPGLGLPASAEVMIGPLPTEVRRRMVLIATADAYHFGIHDAFGTPRLRLDPKPRAKQLEHPLSQAALAAPCVAGLATWLRFPFAELPTASAATRQIAIEDARYSPFSTGGFARRTLQIADDGSLECSAGSP